MLFTCDRGRDGGLYTLQGHSWQFAFFCHPGLAESGGGKMSKDRVNGLPCWWWGCVAEWKEVGLGDRILKLSSCPGLSLSQWAVLQGSVGECCPLWMLWEMVLDDTQTS